MMQGNAKAMKKKIFSHTQIQLSECNYHTLRELLNQLILIDDDAHSHFCQRFITEYILLGYTYLTDSINSREFSLHC